MANNEKAKEILNSVIKNAVENCNNCISIDDFAATDGDDEIILDDIPEDDIANDEDDKITEELRRAAKPWDAPFEDGCIIGKIKKNNW